MARVMVVRHAEKGNGKDTGLKNHLSPKGEADARALGANLPESMKSAPISHIGGSVHSRSVFTAMLIALGSGSDPIVLPSRMELGSEKQFWSMTTIEAYNAALAANDNSVMRATRAILSADDYMLLKKQMVDVVQDHAKLDGNIVLGTHNPWIQLLFEELIGKEYNGNAAELAYLIIDVNDGQIKLVETSLQ